MSSLSWVVEGVLCRCNVPPELRREVQAFVRYLRFDNDTLRQAVQAWIVDEAAARFRYGPLECWDLRNVDLRKVVSSK